MSNDPAEGSEESCNAAGTEGPCCATPALGALLALPPYPLLLQSGVSWAKCPRKLSRTGKDMGVLDVRIVFGNGRLTEFSKTPT